MSEPYPKTQMSFSLFAPAAMVSARLRRRSRSLNSRKRSLGAAGRGRDGRRATVVVAIAARAARRATEAIGARQQAPTGLDVHVALHEQDRGIDAHDAHGDAVADAEATELPDHRFGAID